MILDNHVGFGSAERDKAHIGAVGSAERDKAHIGADSTIRHDGTQSTEHAIVGSADQDQERGIDRDMGMSMGSDGSMGTGKGMDNGNAHEQVATASALFCDVHVSGGKADPSARHRPQDVQAAVRGMDPKLS